MTVDSIYEKSSPAARAGSFKEKLSDAVQNKIPCCYLRDEIPALAACSELEVVRHFTNLSRQNFSIDTHFYPLGSCTMKYNPRAIHALAMLPQFLNTHPLQSSTTQQPMMAMLYQLQQDIAILTGMKAVSLAPMAGAQGEWVGVAMIKAYHQARGDDARKEIIVPTAAHGTNPASAVMCGYKVVEIPTNAEGDIDLSILQQKLGPQTAGIMLTNPSTLGVFERQIKKVADMVHAAGGLLYYDGANLNAILGKYCPGDMGFDVMHLNCHKTFATPHGGGGPGAGPVAAASSLAEFLPYPMVAASKKNNKVNDEAKESFVAAAAVDDLILNNNFSWLCAKQLPKSIGRVTGFYGNVGVLLRAHWYIRMLGREGLPRVSEVAVLNANYCQEKLRDMGYSLAFPTRRASHEFIVTLQPLTKKYNVSALDVAKRLLDLGVHAPTIYFPLEVAECLLIEPTETESLAQLDQFLAAMQTIMHEIKHDTAKLHDAPQRQVVQRLDEVRAARELDLRYRQPPCMLDIDESLAES